MIKQIAVAQIRIENGCVWAATKIIHDDKNASGISVSLELEGDKNLNSAVENLIAQIKAAMKIKLGVAPTFSE